MLIFRMILFALLVSILNACQSKREFSPSEFISYINDYSNGIKVKREFNGVLYNILFQTPELKALYDYESGSITKEKFATEVNTVSNNMSFVFTISDLQNNSSVKSLMFSKEEYGKLLVYANTTMKDDFKLILDRDTNYCSIVHLEPANSIAPVIKVSIGFNIKKAPQPERNIVLVYNDRIFMNGPLKFIFTEEAINNKPKILL